MLYQIGSYSWSKWVVVPDEATAVAARMLQSGLDRTSTLRALRAEGWNILDSYYAYVVAQEELLTSIE